MATTKRERQKAARRIKMEAMQKRAKRRQNTRRGIIVAVVAVLVLGTGALLFSGKTTTTTTTTSTAPATTTSTAPATTTTVAAAPISFSPVTDPSPVGVWGTAPTLVVPPGAPPTKPEIANLITGTGPGAVNGDKFTVQYVLATYSTRKVVQSSWTSPKGFSDTLEPGALISGWVAGMQGMKVGGRRELILPPAVGYQDTSPGAGIAKNDTLVFIIDLLKLNK
jgi:peptidylprolyl isomerase